MKQLKTSQNRQRQKTPRKQKPLKRCRQRSLAKRRRDAETDVIAVCKLSVVENHLSHVGVNC